MLATLKFYQAKYTHSIIILTRLDVGASKHKPNPLRELRQSISIAVQGGSYFNSSHCIPVNPFIQL